MLSVFETERSGSRLPIVTELSPTETLRCAEALAGRRDLQAHTGASDDDLSIVKAVNLLAQRGFEAADENARVACHRLLYSLYNLNVAAPRAGLGHAQSDPLLLTIRRDIERLWIRYELAQIDAPKMRGRPVEECVAFLRQVSLGSDGGHLLFRFMRDHATEEQIKEYFICDHLLNNRFYDIIALSLVGIEQSVRPEVARNFWDEVGQGDPVSAHTHLLRRMTSSVDVVAEIATLEKYPSVEQLEGYNLLMHQAINRSEYYRAIGSLAVMELSDPEQYRMLLEGCERVGLASRACVDLRYYSEHVTIDVVHGKGWLDNVVRPLVLADDGAAQLIVEGCLLRSRSSKRYWDWVLTRMEQKVPN